MFCLWHSVYGPNTWQEWSREGRRPYPLLPRVAPQTALSFIANSVSARITAENLRLPHFSEIGNPVKTEQLESDETDDGKPDIEKHPRNYVVTTEPVRKIIYGARSFELL